MSKFKFENRNSTANSEILAHAHRLTFKPCSHCAGNCNVGVENAIAV